MNQTKGAGNGSTVKRTSCSSRGPQVQFLASTWKLVTVTLVPEDPTPSHGHTCRQNTNARKNNKKKKIKQ